MAKKVALGGMLTALALIMSYVESFIPINFGVPGIKLGLANLVVLSGFYFLDAREVLSISVMRILLAGFLFGNVASIAYSLAGGLLSFLVMYLLIRTGKFSVIGVSIAGGVSHNIGQIIVAVLVTKTRQLFFYFPVLVVAGVVTGILIGALSDLLMKRLGRGRRRHVE